MRADAVVRGGLRHRAIWSRQAGRLASRQLTRAQQIRSDIEEQWSSWPLSLASVHESVLVLLLVHVFRRAMVGKLLSISVATP